MSIGDLPLFSEASPASLEPLAGRVSSRRISAGEVLIEQGDAADFFVIVVAGEARVERHTRTGRQELGTVRSGDIVGELGLLRCRPRGASVIAVTDLDVLCGDAAAFHFLLDVPGVHDRLQRVVSLRVAENVTPIAMTASGDVEVAFRPLLPSDREELFQGVRDASAETLRRRFFSAGVPQAVLEYLIDVDYVDHFAWVCVDTDGSGIGVGRYIRSQDRDEVAEFTFVVKDAWQGRGVGTLLLGAVGVAAGAAGIRAMTASFLQDNEPVRVILRKAGARFGVVEPGVSSAEIPVAATEMLLDDERRSALRSAVADVVSAAGLAQT